MLRDEAYLLDMLLEARRVQRWVGEKSFEAFFAEEVHRYAAERCVQIIGEAAAKVSHAFRREHPEIPWAGIVGMRHRLVHDYRNVSAPKLWTTISRNIADLIPLLERLVPSELEFKALAEQERREGVADPANRDCKEE